MKLVLELDGDRFDVEVERRTDSLAVECEGEQAAAAVARTGGTLEIRLGGRRALVEILSDTEAVVDGRRVRFAIADFQPGSGAAAGGAGGKTPLRAVMPGRVVRVLVGAGAAVAKGQPVMVLESMKMQNELLSPAAGKVAGLAVREGDIVEAGKVLGHVES